MLISVLLALMILEVKFLSIRMIQKSISSPKSFQDSNKSEHMCTHKMAFNPKQYEHYKLKSIVFSDDDNRILKEIKGDSKIRSSLKLMSKDAA